MWWRPCESVSIVLVTSLLCRHSSSAPHVTLLSCQISRVNGRTEDARISDMLSLPIVAMVASHSHPLFTLILWVLINQ